MKQENSHEYDDIIHLERPVSTRHARMSMIDRGAQFSPFAALVGYEAVIRETARQTAPETWLDEHGKELLDRKLRYIADHPELREITFHCFQQDEWKPGGSYVTVTGRVKRIDLYRKTILMEDGQEFWIENIRDIEGVD